MDWRGSRSVWAVRLFCVAILIWVVVYAIHAGEVQMKGTGIVTVSVLVISFLTKRGRREDWQ